ncbi:MAG: insulinase family protein [Bdellovibrionales bacterium]|nr:insulinase family protein [Bdellovibrionales bacterium]
MNPCERITLANGLQILLVPSAAAPVVALQGWVRYGAADEAREVAGVAHLFEHLLFKGTERRPVGAIAREVEGLGGDINAYTSYDQTVMHMTLPSRRLEQGVDLLADAILNSVVDAEELEREKEVILEEIRRRNDMPGSVAGDLLRQELYGEHPYARPVIGYADVVKNMPREKILTEYKKHYTSTSLFLVVAGDFKKEEVIAACEKHFAAIRPGQAPKARPQVVRPFATARKASGSYSHYATPDAIFHFAWLTVDGTHRDNAALDALAVILGQGESSRLTRKLVHEKRLLRGIGTGAWSPKDTGYFGISMKGPPGTGKKMNDIVAAIDECMRAPITEKELEKAKHNLLSTAVYSKETVDGLAQRYGYFEALAGDWSLDEAYLEHVRALRVSDVEKVKAEYLDWNQVCAAGIVPEKDSLPTFSPPKTPREVAPPKNAKPGTSHTTESFQWRGLSVVLRRIPTLPIFSARWVGLGGARLEPAAQAGLGTLWSRTVTEGGRGQDGKLWSREEVHEALDAMSASMGAFHGKNSWGYQMDGLAHDFEHIFALMAATYHQPTFADRIVDEERSHQINDIRTSDDSPSSVVNRAFNAELFGKHPYARPSLGSTTSVKKVNAKALAAYHRKSIAQPQALCVVGDIDRATLEDCLTQHFGKTKFSRSSSLAKARKIAYRPGARTLRLPLNKEQTHILTGFPSCKLGDKDRWALAGLVAVLAGQGGRLFLELRDKLSLCYSIGPSRMEALDGGFFGFYIATSPDKVTVALEALDLEIEKVIRSGVPESEWERAREFLMGNHEIESQHYAGQCMEMALNEVYGIGFEEYFEFTNHIAQVKASDLARVTKKYFRRDTKATRVTAIVGPKEKASKV